MCRAVPFGRRSHYRDCTPRVSGGNPADIEHYHCTKLPNQSFNGISESVKQGVIGRGTIFSNERTVQSTKRERAPDR
jgi:hypothetical protein